MNGKIYAECVMQGSWKKIFYYVLTASQTLIQSINQNLIKMYEES